MVIKFDGVVVYSIAYHGGSSQDLPYPAKACHDV
jgi:hypothetical protein